MVLAARAASGCALCKAWERGYGTAAPIDRPHTLAIDCTNPVSGARWQISIDHDHATVDSNPAKVRDAAITWHDAKDGGSYTLDRDSGELTVVVASGTGGYFLHHRCHLPP